MTRLIKTDAAHPDFAVLVQHLDTDLAIRDGEDHLFYSQFNAATDIKFVIIAYEDEQPAGCGAIKEFDTSTMEVKRMYVVPLFRQKQIATKILGALEDWAKALSCTSCVLETGKKQGEATALYEKNGYRRIPNYGQYAGIENSLCFEKKI